MYQYWFIHFHKCTKLAQDVKDGATVWRGRGLWGISVLYDLRTNVFSHFSLKRQPSLGLCVVFFFFVISVNMCMPNRSVMSDSLRPHGAWLLCPWDYPG